MSSVSSPNYLSKELLEGREAIYNCYSRDSKSLKEKIEKFKKEMPKIMEELGATLTAIRKGIPKEYNFKTHTFDPISSHADEFDRCHNQLTHMPTDKEIRKDKYLSLIQHYVFDIDYGNQKLMLDFCRYKMNKSEEQFEKMMKFFNKILDDRMISNDKYEEKFLKKPRTGSNNNSKNSSNIVLPTKPSAAVEPNPSSSQLAAPSSIPTNTRTKKPLRNRITCFTRIKNWFEKVLRICKFAINKLLFCRI